MSGFYVIEGKRQLRKFVDARGAFSSRHVDRRGELKSLIARCDSLKAVIEKLDESARKVYLRRLQLCRDLFAFVLESKEKQ